MGFTDDGRGQGKAEYIRGPDIWKWIFRRPYNTLEEKGMLIYI